MEKKNIDANKDTILYTPVVKEENNFGWLGFEKRKKLNRNHKLKYVEKYNQIFGFF